MTCRYDRETATYQTGDGECRYDEHGDRTYHCSARRTCSQHVGQDEQTCARCVSRVRQDVRAIIELAALLPVEALTGGVDSEAASLAGPAADVEAWSWRKISAKQGIAWHVSLEEDDDDWHPYTVLTRAHWNVAMNPAYPPLPEVMTATDSAAYLDKHLHRIAQDPNQDFSELRQEMRTCRNHLEAVLHNSTRPERGAPCPECGTAVPPVFVRLQRHYGHWCVDPDCGRAEHYPNDEGDRWVCPRNPGHAWTEAAYRSYVEERTA